MAFSGPRYAYLSESGIGFNSSLVREATKGDTGELAKGVRVL